MQASTACLHCHEQTVLPSSQLCVQGELGKALRILPACAHLPLLDIAGLINALPCPTLGPLVESLRPTAELQLCKPDACVACRASWGRR